MNFRKLLTYLTMGTAAAMPIATAQNPTILQGNYITNVFGNSNFVLNPNAQTNVANVTNATRSTTTPLVATSEFTLSLASGANATWTLRAFDGGMKGQNCEARFTYRGFATATTKAEIVQNSLVVASLTLTPTTDPRIASINFPCGDLVNATTFRIAQTTANMTGTNEIGGIYVGLATNMANVAQAEFVGRLTWAGLSGTSDNVNINTTTFTNLGAFAAAPSVLGNVTSPSNAPAITIPNFKAGNYVFVLGSGLQCYAGGVTSCNGAVRFYDGTSLATTVSSVRNDGATGILLGLSSTQFELQYTGATTSKTFNLQGIVGATSQFLRIERTAVQNEVTISVYRFPLSSELVVTPERQGNWYVNAYHDGANIALSTATVSSKTEMTNASLTLKPVANSQPVATLCASGNNPPAVSTGNTTCSAGNESLGITFNIPSVGGYEVCATFSQNTKVPQNGYTDATFSIEETSTSSSTNLTDNPTVATFTQISSVSDLGISNPVKACSNLNFTSLGQKAVRLLYRQNVSGTVTTNQILADATLGRGVIWSVVPLSTESNSALYVQGPVKASETGDTIATGYQNEWSTRAITDSSLRTQATPVAGTWYYPWGGELTLPAGNWMLCYSVPAQSDQTLATSIASVITRIENKTDNTELVQNLSVPTNGGSVQGVVASHSACMPTAITTSKVFRVGIKYTNWAATPTVNNLYLRCDQTVCRLQAIRLN